MNINISKTPLELGQNAANLIAQELNKAIAEKGEARLLVSTGSSQFETLDALTRCDVDFSCVEMFHLDEYIGLDESHIASFRKYLKERLIAKVNFKAYYLVDGTGEVEKNIAELTIKLREKPVDVGVIGIGENGHVAFNDPPANFDNENAYIVVNLDEKCKLQQVGEGWFATLDDVPKQAISITVKEILKCNIIVTSVPHKVKADAIKNTLIEDVNNMIPATILKTHKNWNLFIDSTSASGFLKY